jgi:GNAT superfamily N-acetyltransferase
LRQGYLEFYETDLSAEITHLTYARLVAGDGMHGALARDETDRAIGLVHWLPQPSTWSRNGYCYLEDLFVAPEVRGGGVGGSLIAYVRDWAAAAGLARSTG